MLFGKKNAKQEETETMPRSGDLEISSDMLSSEWPDLHALLRANRIDFPVNGPTQAPAPGPNGGTVICTQTEEEGVTEAELPLGPIAGWLVCTHGNDRGRAFELQAGDNYIGRQWENKVHDINLNDDTVSRDITADVYYVRKGRYFLFSRMRNTHTECQLNGRVVVSGEYEMERYGKITVGETELMLIPLCCDEFDWDDWDALPQRENG